jgi:hypothetical protein
MSMLKGTALALTLALASTAPAFAQGGESSGNMHDLRAMVFAADGKMASGKLTDKGLADVMKTAKPVSGGAVLFRHQGKLYLMEDATESAYQKWRDMMIPTP